MHKGAKEIMGPLNLNQHEAVMVHGEMSAFERASSFTLAIKWLIKSPSDWRRFVACANWAILHSTKGIWFVDFWREDYYAYHLVRGKDSLYVIPSKIKVGKREIIK